MPKSFFQPFQRRSQGDMVASLAHYLMIKNALLPDHAEAMVLDPDCGPSYPIVPDIKFRGDAPEL